MTTKAPGRIHVIGMTNNVFGNLYARDDEGTIFAGRLSDEDFWGKTPCETHILDYKWSRYPKSKAPAWVLTEPPQITIDFGTEPPTVVTFERVDIEEVAADV